VRKTIDNTIEVEESMVNEEEPSISDEAYWSRLVKSEENPGWLWDPVENQWVADPNHSSGGDA
jgi:hypothetical protein